jgi:hypothetical protein
VHGIAPFAANRLDRGVVELIIGVFGFLARTFFVNSGANQDRPDC